METVYAAATRQYPGITFDCALPQGWVDSLPWDPRGHVVWGYPTGSFSGTPLPITEHGRSMLKDS